MISVSIMDGGSHGGSYTMAISSAGSHGHNDNGTRRGTSPEMIDRNGLCWVFKFTGWSFKQYY